MKKKIGCFFAALAVIILISAGSGIQAELFGQGGQLTEEELLKTAGTAHHQTVLLFTEAFEKDIFHNSKPAWKEMRPQLLEYWDAGLVDGKLRDFYCNHLHEWGYEMGFAFPLWQQDNIKHTRIIRHGKNQVIAEFLTAVDYEISKYVRIKLLRKNGKWVITSL